MTLARTEMKRGTKALRAKKSMERGTSTMSRGTGIGRGTVQLARSSSIQTSAKEQKAAKLPVVATAEAPKLKAHKRALKITRKKLTAIQASARNEECTLRFPCCNYRVDTTVLCHRNGAGGGMKAPDTDAAYGCYACHTMLDGHSPRPDGFTRDMMLARFDRAVERTHIRLAVKGLIRMLVSGGIEEVGAAEKGSVEKQKPSPAGTGNGFNSNQLIGQSMSRKIVPQNNYAQSRYAHLHVAFLVPKPSMVHP
ncbi:MAG: nuclease domain-containing protein [Telluria sp.]